MTGMRLIESYKEGKTFWKERESTSPFTGETGERIPAMEIIPEREYQEFLGFGAAFTEAAATVFYRLSPKNQEKILTDCFDKAGQNYRFCRTHMNSCDFSLGNYHYLPEKARDLSGFSLDRDRTALIPLIKRAQEKADNAINLIASPWSPAGWMKDSGTMNGGGVLLPEYRDLWAGYFCRYIQEYEKEGLNLWGVTVQNEPEAVQTWDSCIYTPEAERDFVRDHLGPALVREGLQGVNILIHDQWRDRLFDRSRVILEDPEAARYIWGAGFHWYEGDNFQNLDYFHEIYPDKGLIFTEGCQEYGTHHGSWDLGERYAFSIINDLNRWTRAWIDWNLLLDMTGGPNHVNNLCSAPILADPGTDRLFYQSSFYYMGHFSRYIRPGARRIFASVPEGLYATAFRNPDSSLVAVVLNREEKEKVFTLKYRGENKVIRMKPRSIVTAVL
jgi:glucosylceramidase